MFGGSSSGYSFEFIYLMFWGFDVYIYAYIHFIRFGRFLMLEKKMEQKNLQQWYLT